MTSPRLQPQIWMPDIRSTEFVTAAHEQSMAIAKNGHDPDDQAFVDAISSSWDDTQQA